MAINLDERYPGRANGKTLSYPQGSFKNRTSPTSKDGTYLEQDWANDWAGFFQRMMVVSGISPNGAVDTAESSQYFDALAKVISDATPDASTTKKGLVELATTAQAQALTNDATVITPKKLADSFGGSNQLLSVDTGYQKMPGGLIIQWGGVQNNQRATFPIAFSDGVLPRVAFGSQPGSNPGYVSGTIDNTGFNYQNPGSGYSAAWIAIGH